MSIYIDEFKTMFERKSSIQALRNKVLELAIQGKLVPQDPNDESASKLVQNIKNERSQLVASKLIKKQPIVKQIDENAMSYYLPSGWIWVRLGELTNLITDGTHKTPQYVENGVPFLSVRNISQGVIDKINVKFIKETEHVELIKRCKPEKGDLLICRIGTLGETYRLQDDYEFSIFVSLGLLKLTNKEIGHYLELMMNSPEFYRQIELVKVGGSHTNKINLEDIPNFAIPLPPLAEQNRIVAKVESLMSEIDKLEKVLEHKEHLLELLPKAVVDAIGNSRTGEELKENLMFVINNFETVFQTPESMQELRNVILQLAIEGKLVPQDPNDEPASELVKKIHGERVRLVKDGKIKRQKPLEPIGEDEIPFEIPGSWEWVRLEEITTVITKGSSPKWQGVSYTENKEVLFVTSENVGNGKLLLDSKKYVEHKFNEIESRSILKKNDILMNIVGGSIGRTAIYNIDDIANINQAVCLIRVLPNYVNLDYLINFFNSQTCISYMFDKQVDNARANLSMGNISKFMIPIPPKPEQDCIVEKVESMMSLINQLEQTLVKKKKIIQMAAETITA